MKITTILKTIFILQYGTLIKQVRYKTKEETIKQYNHFKKYGYFDPATGEKLENITFQIL